jgi:hypothetical protein
VLLVHTYLVLVSDVGLLLLVYVLVPRATETAYSPAARGSMPCLSGLGEGFFCLGCVGGGNEKRIWDI